MVRGVRRADRRRTTFPDIGNLRERHGTGPVLRHCLVLRRPDKPRGSGGRSVDPMAFRRRHLGRTCPWQAASGMAPKRASGGTFVWQGSRRVVSRRVQPLHCAMRVPFQQRPLPHRFGCDGLCKAGQVVPCCNYLGAIKSRRHTLGAPVWQTFGDAAAACQPRAFHTTISASATACTLPSFRPQTHMRPERTR